MVPCLFGRNKVLREGQYFSQGTSQTRTVSIFLVSFVRPFTPQCRRIFPIMYLPKTWPSHPVPRRYSAFDLRSAPSAYKTVLLSPVWPVDACPVAKAKAATPTVQASYAACWVHAYCYTYKAVAVFPIWCHVLFRRFYSSETYCPKQRCSRSCKTSYQRRRRTFRETFDSMDQRWDG